MGLEYGDIDIFEVELSFPARTRSDIFLGLKRNKPIKFCFSVKNPILDMVNWRFS
jgi:hypothetical protein